MNYRMIVQVISYILRLEAALLLPSLMIAVVRSENTVVAFIAAIIILLAVSSVSLFLKPETKTIYAREGFVIVAASWILMSFFGALPAYFSGYIPSFVDSLFESASGLTTTGSSILKDIEILPRSLLFWRSFSHWVGGMGVLVFMMAIMPLAGGRSMHIMRAEGQAPNVGKLVPKIKNSAMILYGMYIFLTVLLFVLLLAGDMPVFDSLCHAFATAGTGGFSIKNASIAHYNSPYIQWVISIFMVVFSINFNLYYLLLMGQFRRVFKNEELLIFLSIVLVSTAVVALNILPILGGGTLALRESFFQVTSVMSTSGFATTDFNLWPEFSRSLLMMLMFVGACAGSTGGGFKVARLIIITRSIRNEIKKMLHPRSVSAVKLEGKPVEKDTVMSVYAFVGAYAIIASVSVLLISLDNFDFTTTITTVVSCLSNIGPGLGLVGPSGSFAGYSAFSKLVLIMDMLTGRLEIFPMIMLFSPSVWRRSLR
ncbi:MAG: TrkH family potassium uptake protein [Christensenellales bacterium]